MAFAKITRFIDRLALMKLMDLFVCKKNFIQKTNVKIYDGKNTIFGNRQFEKFW